MGKKIYEIKISGEDFFHCDEDGYIMIFDSPEQIEEWAKQNDIDLEKITYFEDEVLDSTKVEIDFSEDE